MAMVAQPRPHVTYEDRFFESKDANLARFSLDVANFSDS